MFKDTDDCLKTDRHVLIQILGDSHIGASVAYGDSNIEFGLVYIQCNILQKEVSLIIKISEGDLTLRNHIRELDPRVSDDSHCHYQGDH